MDVREVATVADVRGVIEVHHRAWRAAYADLLPATVIHGLDRELSAAEARDYRDRVTQPENAFLVAVDDAGTVRGYVHLRWGTDTKMFVGSDGAGLKELYVDPDSWGQGIGNALLEAGLDHIPDGYAKVALEMLAGNDRAAGFYRARGFERVGSGEVSIAGEEFPTGIYARSLDAG